jgi:hypothetical protein
VLVPVLVGGAAVAVAALAVFQPWRLFVDVEVVEALPTSAASAPPTATAPSTTSAEPSPQPTAPVVLATGRFVTHEHPTTGTVRVLELPDGSRVLRIEGLDTTNGPDLRVWLSDQPVLEGRDGWFVFDDGAYVELGELKGNRGDQNYALPADVDLDALSSVSIWCARFSVSFGAASLAAA